MMAEEPKTNADDAVRFLEWKRPGGPWPITIADPDWGQGTPTVWAETADEVRALVAEHSGLNGLFYTTALQRKGVEKKPRREDLEETRHFHVDLDPPKGIDPAAIDAWVEAELVRVREQTHSPKPSAIIRSGNGLHLLWALDQPMYIGGTAERWTDVEERTRALCVDFGADGSTWNCDRLLRLPGTDNLPNGKKRKAGRVAKPTWIEEWHPDRVYPLADFRCEPPTGSQNGKPGTTAPLAAERGKLLRLANPDELEQWDVPLWAQAVIVEGTDPTEPDRWGGDRSKAVWAVTCELARRGVPLGLTVGILTDKTWGIAAHVLDQPDHVGYAWKQVENARREVEADGEPFQTDKKTGARLANQHNLRLSLLKLGVRVRFDTFANRPTLDGLSGFGPHLDDAAMARLWLRVDEEHHLKFGKEYFWTVVVDAARRDAFHPVVEYFAGLQWDGVERLDKWMSVYLGAADNEYTRHVGAIMLVAAVRRVRQPGCKFDEMVIFESEQGKAKSTALSILAVREDWFSDDLPLGASAQVVIERTEGRFFIEAAELSGMGKKGIENLKAFLSRRIDRSRMAYGRLPHEAPRHFIVVGTTNDDKYLSDSTGNRRFWPVRVDEIDLEGLTRDRDQLWAEAAAREAGGASIRLDRALWQVAAVEQDDRRLIDPFVHVLADVLGDINGKLPRSEVWEIIGTPVGLRTPQLEERVGRSMRELGFEQKAARFRGNPVSAFLRGTAEERTARILIERETDDYGIARGAWTARVEGSAAPMQHRFDKDEPY